MNRIAPLFVALAIASGCASQTVIRSNPSGATVKNRYGQVLGKTPYEHEDTETWNHRETFTLELDGHEPAQVSIRRDEVNAGRMIGFGLGGFLFIPLWAGLFWAADYEESYGVELKPTAQPTTHARAH